MELPPPIAARLLLVEDSRADAQAVEVCLRSEGLERYDITLVTTLGAAEELMAFGETDVVLLDLTLPDSAGSDTLVRLRAVADDVPIVVLTGLDDDDLAMRCIAAGAQDYLCKAEMTPHTLRRVVGYALGRARGAQLQTLRAMLQGCRALSSQEMLAPVTRTLAGLGPIKDRSPEAFLDLLETYRDLLEKYMDHLRLRKEKPRDGMEILVTSLGDLGASPRDVIDIHMGALDFASRKLAQSRIPAFTSDGRLFALEMMGLLVEYYRLGYRRLFPERSPQ